MGPAAQGGVEGTRWRQRRVDVRRRRLGGGRARGGAQSAKPIDRRNACLRPAVGVRAAAGGRGGGGSRGGARGGQGPAGPEPKGQGRQKEEGQGQEPSRQARQRRQRDGGRGADSASTAAVVASGDRAAHVGRHAAPRHRSPGLVPAQRQARVDRRHRARRRDVAALVRVPLTVGHEELGERAHLLVPDPHAHVHGAQVHEGRRRLGHRLQAVPHLGAERLELRANARHVPQVRRRAPRAGFCGAATPSRPRRAAPPACHVRLRVASRGGPLQSSPEGGAHQRVRLARAGLPALRRV
mmetsp:Transcript_32006/g.83616  ORF Transcript_32006/g.83616 Transcript_32006/m.83616 type:complete len:297 (-) Transcript_32006:499-1389(-)